MSTNPRFLTVRSSAACGRLTRYFSDLTRLKAWAIIVEGPGTDRHSKQRWAPAGREAAFAKDASDDAGQTLTGPSLAIVTRATPSRRMAELRFLGFLFESLVVRDLHISTLRRCVRSPANILRLLARWTRRQVGLS